MYCARLICSDEACGLETEVVEPVLTRLDAVLCEDCGCATQVLGISFEASATAAVLWKLSRERSRIDAELAELLTAA